MGNGTVACFATAWALSTTAATEPRFLLAVTVLLLVVLVLVLLTVSSPLLESDDTPSTDSVAEPLAPETAGVPFEVGLVVDDSVVSFCDCGSAGDSRINTAVLLTSSTTVNPNFLRAHASGIHPAKGRKRRPCLPSGCGFA